MDKGPILTYQAIRIGIDISDYSIEVLGLNKKGAVRSYSRTVLPQGIIEKGEIVKKGELARSITKSLTNARPQPLQSSPRREIKAVISLPESRVFSRNLELSDYNLEKDLARLVKEDMSQFVPFSPDELYWDYVVASSKDKEKTGAWILYAACPKKIIDAYTEEFKLAGITPVVFGLEAFSLARSFLSCPKKSRHKQIIKSESAGAVMIVDIGAKTTTVSIFNAENVLLFSALIPLAGHKLTEMLAKKASISMNEAERKKKQIGLLGDLDEAVIISAILKEGLAEIVKELRRAIDYGEKKLNQHISEIILAGGTALLPGIDTYLADKIGKEVVVGDPLNSIRSDHLSNNNRMAVLFSNVVGLAWRAIQDPFNSQEINLLPEDGQRFEKRIYNQEKTAVKVFSLAIFFGGLALFAAILITIFILRVR